VLRVDQVTLPAQHRPVLDQLVHPGRIAFHGRASCRTANPVVSEPIDRDPTVRTRAKPQASSHDPQFGGWYPFR
jgi:hypothetical protein